MIKVEHPTGCNPALGMDDFSSIFSNVAPTGSTVSINENFETEFNIFPTPADEQINIKFGQNISGITRIILSDLTGRAYLSVAFDDIRQDQVRVINTTGLKEGMYLLTLTNDKGKNTRKVLIKR
jgi:aminopeptidase YwaD